MTISNKIKDNPLIINYTTANALLEREWSMAVVGEHLTTCHMSNRERRNLTPLDDYFIQLDYDSETFAVGIRVTRVFYSGRGYCLCRHSKDVQTARVPISYGGYLNSIRWMLGVLTKGRCQLTIRELVSIFADNDSFAFYLSESCHLLIKKWSDVAGFGDVSIGELYGSNWSFWRATFARGKILKRVETLLRCHNGMGLR